MELAELHRDGACCGACGHAAEVALNGGPPLLDQPLLRVALDAAGIPVGVTLVLTHLGVAAPEIVPVRRSSIVLGRMPPADVVVDSHVLSRRQFELRFTLTSVEVEDLQSACGTFINGRQVDGPTALREGDTIEVADLVVSIRAAG